VLDARYDHVFPRLIPVLLIGDILWSSIPFVLIVALSFAALHRRKPRFSPVMAAMLAWYGSFIFVYSGTFFGHLSAGLFLLAGYLCVKGQRYLLSGLFLGLAFLCEYTVIVAAPVWMLLAWLRDKSPRPALLVGLGTAPSLTAIAAYNWAITGNPTELLYADTVATAYKALAYHYGFSHPSWQALFGLSFSGSMGLFVFAPILCLVAWFVLRALVRDRSFLQKLAVDYGAVFCAINFVVIASFFTWWGGWSYGPRYLLAMAVVLVYEGLLFLARFRIPSGVIAAVTGFGLLSAWCAKATVVYFVPDPLFVDHRRFVTLIDLLAPEFLANRCNANNLGTMLLDLAPRTGAIVWIGLFLVSLGGLHLWHYFWFPPAGETGQPARQRPDRS